MATYLNFLNQLHGELGDVVIQRWKNKTTIRTKSQGLTKQTPATKSAFAAFVALNRFSAGLRKHYAIDFALPKRNCTETGKIAHFLKPLITGGVFNPLNITHCDLPPIDVAFSSIAYTEATLTFFADVVVPLSQYAYPNPFLACVFCTPDGRPISFVEIDTDNFTLSVPIDRNQHPVVYCTSFLFSRTVRGVFGAAAERFNLIGV